MQSFPRILIANRGEIARRIARTCKKLGYYCVAVYSPLDRFSLHLQEADEAIELPGESAAETYLNALALIAAAEHCGATAIHPGYGFLSESAAFAQRVLDAGMTFIGPSPTCMKLLGDKDRARALAQSLNIATPPGLEVTASALPSDKELQALGFPLMIKAVAGGGGKGMRKVSSPAELPQALAAAGREAQAAFGNAALFLEKAIFPARHIEVQLIGDTDGNVSHIFERDCSLQRRFQKVIEEAPASFLSEKIRRELYAAAEKLATAAKLTGLATAEFLLPASDAGREFYFLECNPRLQVEHCVTEMVTNLDLVELQMRVCFGEPLTSLFKRPRVSGVSIQARLYAEDPFQNFLPTGGYLRELTFPVTDEVRIECALAASQQVHSRFDPLLAKLIVHGSNRKAALQKLFAALDATTIVGVENNLAFLMHLTKHLDAQEAPATTTELENLIPSFALQHDVAAFVAAAYACQLLQASSSPLLGAFRLGVTEELPLWQDSLLVNSQALTSPQRFEVTARTASHSADSFSVRGTVGETPFHVAMSGGLSPSIFTIEINNISLEFRAVHTAMFIRNGVVWNVENEKQWTAGSTSAAESDLFSPLPGTVLAVHIRAGQEISSGDELVTIESMKMEHTLRASTGGIITGVLVSPGQLVHAGEQLFSRSS